MRRCGPSIMRLMYLAVQALLAAQCVSVRTPADDQSFRYEKLQNYGLGKRVIPNYRRANAGYAYPEPLRVTTAGYVRSPYRSIYQGARRRGDRRVYMKRFDYAPKVSGHPVFCQAVTDCKITHMAVETAAGVPVLLRGGAGYHHFNVVIKAAAGVALQGTLKAYCRNPDVGD